MQSIPATTIEGEEAPRCGCGDPKAPNGHCPDGSRLWGELLGARDELRDAGHRPPKRLIDAFAEARDTYHRHVAGEVA